MIYCETHLEFQSGTSDKEYVARVEDCEDGTYAVNCFYGRRGSTLRQTSKGTYNTIGSALAIYEKVVREKTNKGYEITRTVKAGESDPTIDDVFGILFNSPTPEPVEEVIKISDSLRSTEDERQKAIERLRKACAS